MDTHDNVEWDSAMSPPTAQTTDVVVGDETDLALYVAFDGSAFYSSRIDTDPLTATAPDCDPMDGAC